MTRSENERWARDLIRRTDSTYRFRWEAFDAEIKNLQNVRHICLDLGCGLNEELDSSFVFHTILGADTLFPDTSWKRNGPFIQADIYNLPFRKESIHFIVLRFVVEHLALPEPAFREINRVLTPGGRALLMTTNIISPFIFLPKLLSYKWRKKILLKLYNVHSEDVFPTYHRLNRYSKVKKLIPSFTIEKWQYIQDVNWTRKFLFIIFYSWHLLTKWLRLQFMRTNFIALLRKN